MIVKARRAIAKKKVSRKNTAKKKVARKKIAKKKVFIFIKCCSTKVKKFVLCSA